MGLAFKNCHSDRQRRQRHRRRGPCPLRCCFEDSTVRARGIAEFRDCRLRRSLRIIQAARPEMNPGSGSLFGDDHSGPQASAPLAERMRPITLDEVIGQQHLLGPGKPLRTSIERDRVPSMILWGPPGVGKTTIAQIIAKMTKSDFVPFSAVTSGIKEIKEVMAAAERAHRVGRRTILFVDEIHRFNKAQQDAFLPHVERGAITLVGATTENPSFSVNAAVLSRVTVARLEPLRPEQLEQLLARALIDSERGLGRHGLKATPGALLALARAADGDARRALGLLDLVVARMLEQGRQEVDERHLEDLVDRATLRHDKAGDDHFDLLSAFIKSMRGTDPDAAVYYLMRMIEAGEDPSLILRRMVIFASEDVGNADPRAL